MSKIKNLKLIAVEVPLNKTFSGSKYKLDKRCTVITRIETDDGLVSEIYNGDNRTQTKEIIKIINEELWPLVKDGDIFKSQQLWEKMFIQVVPKHHEDYGIVMQAIACVDSAIWDLRGKAAGKNVAALLGGYHDELPMMGICGYYIEGKTLGDIEKETDWIYNTAGLHAIKFKVGGLAPEEDVKRIAAARQGAPKMTIAVDANRGWDFLKAVKFAQLAEQYDIRWFEEPYYWFDDAYGMARIKNKINIPITSGQSEISGNGVKRMLEARAVDIVNFDASEAGGITEWQRVAGMCHFYGVQMAHHEEPQIAMQMLASVPHSTYLECFPDPDRDPVWEKMVLNRPPLIDGKIKVMTDPGFGLKLDWDFIKKYQVN
ncbi:MAG: mandelate racemase/muconate lactonizing enzyme family protein [Spirochaetaceae bacterium]|nr:mandelate racemase/muconate lactonizing enzyme family protein [Spirochaetaceae bacterium]